MKYKLIKNRKLVQDEKFAGYNKENRAEKLEFEIPESLSEYTATINFETDEGNVYDLLDNGIYTLKNNITKYDKVRFYLEFTKEISENNLEVIKTEVKTLEFGDSFDVNTEITEEEISILDTLIAQTNSAINRANAISQDLENKVATDYYRGATGEQGPQGLKGDTGSAGADAKINGVNTLTIEAGTNITLDQEGNTLTINSTGGSGGTSDYTNLTNKPKINNVELKGNKTLNDLGIQPAGNYALKSEIPTKTSDLTNDSGFITGYTETDPTVPNYVKNITQANITSWNNKSDFSGNYNDLSNKPTIPSEVTESTVSGWGFTKNTGTYSKPSGGIPKTDLASAVQTSLGKADTALQSISSSDVTSALGYTPYNSTNPNGYTSNVGTITGITMNGASKGTSGVVDLGTVITSHQDISGKLDTSKVKNVYSTTNGDVYDVIYINSTIGDIESLLSEV